MDQRLEHITLFAFESFIKRLNLPFAYYDETQKEAGLILGVAEFYEMYALEVYNLCTSEQVLKNDPTIKKILEATNNAKNDSGPLLSYVYKGDKPAKVMYRWDVLMPILNNCTPSIDFILDSFGLEPLKTRNYNSYYVINLEVCSPRGENKAINVQRPWETGDKLFKDLDIHVIFCFLMKVNELLNDQEFYIYPKHLKIDYGDYM